MIISAELEQIALQATNPAVGTRLVRLARKVVKLEDAANKLQALEDAGIDNVEAYSQGMQLYYERYPEKDDYA